ncbi:hypothetical protein [Acrocarpospora sp. B8E8]|uniref:hypothetical protein n=1 Tax=Acrocarpospora sp. B8E8 TaxID=3153572 RepID=UPI00325CAD74
MIDFTYGAYPHRDGLEMLSGTGERKGVTMRRVETHGSTTWETHEAYAVYGERVQLIGTAHDQWAAFRKIELWYAEQDNYYLAWA